MLQESGARLIFISKRGIFMFLVLCALYYRGVWVTHHLDVWYSEIIKLFIRKLLSFIYSFTYLFIYFCFLLKTWNQCMELKPMFSHCSLDKGVIWTITKVANCYPNQMVKNKIINCILPQNIKSKKTNT